MARWEFPIPVDRASDVPVYLQVARALAEDMRRGRLKPGDRLPGSRALAAGLSLNRNTVVAAYRELEAEGWITGAEASGTFVSSDLPVNVPRAFGAVRHEVPGEPGFDLTPAPRIGLDPVIPRGTLSFGTGLPDLRLIPVDALARAYHRAIRRDSERVLAYHTCGRCVTALVDGVYGARELRAALAAMLAATRRLAASWETVLVTRGAQMAIGLVARALLQPGDVAALEELGNLTAREAFRQTAARIELIPVDREGLDVGAVQALAEREPRLKVVSVTPHHQFPTTVTLSPGRRMQLLELARRHRFAILEDDYDHEFHYDAHPILPLASVDTAGVVVYVGTLSKILAPGLRLGYVVAPRPVVDRLAMLRVIADRQGDLAGEVAVAQLLQNGDVMRHVRRMRSVYRSRRDFLAAALRRELGEALRFSVPTGGMGVWAEADDGLDVDRWETLAREEGTSFYPGSAFALDMKPRTALRLGFSNLDESEILEAVRRLERARRRLASSRFAPAAAAAAGR
jgi:GntR family transcriptional regulator/MocR family aminotransferase